MDKKVLRSISYGLYAIGVLDGERLCGCIVNTVFQVTSKPTIAISMNKDNYTWQLIEKTGKFSASILSTSTNPNAIASLGFSSGKDRDKFQGLNVIYAESGLPILNENCVGYITAKVISVTDAGSHMLIHADVVSGAKLLDLEPMTYKYYQEVIKGKAPKNAPTYIEPKAEGVYTCGVCGYIYDEGDFEMAPPDYICPVCKAPKSEFKKQ